MSARSRVSTSAPDDDARSDETSRNPAFDAIPIQELIITLFGEYCVDNRAIWSGGLVKLLEELGFSPAASRIALSRVVGRGLLVRSREGRRVYYNTTPRLLKVIADGHRQTFWFRYAVPPWDGSWTLVWYAIPEEHLLARRRLSRRLVFLGFGALQDGTWLTPHNHSEEVQQLSVDLGISPFLVVLTGSSPGWIDPSLVISRAWDVGRAQLRYAAFLDSYGYLSAGKAVAALSPREAFLIRTQILEEFRQIAVDEPKVAEDDLLPPGPRRSAIDSFNKIDAALRPLATSFVHQVCDPDTK